MARRLPVKSVYVDEAALEYLSSDDFSAVLSRWGFARTGDPQLAEAWVVVDTSAYLPFTVIPLEPNQPIRVVLGPPTADRLAMVSHEFCHVAARSACHLLEGLCAATITSSTNPFPGEKELALHFAPLLSK